MIGRKLRHYHIVEKLGEGGMGEVFRARDEHLGRDVAVKVLPSGTFSDEAARRRFRREAEALSKLNHPSIATVHDFDTQEGVDFLVMECVEGQTLKEKLEKGPLPQEDVSSLGTQITEALEEAHERGVVHRDLKPSNIAVTPKGRVKVFDFCLARLLHPVVTDTATTAVMTEQLQVAGTLPYMAPEDLRGARSDHRSDLYSLGVVLYEMATGRRPFEERLSPALTDAILNRKPVPPRSRNPEISAGLERVILKALEKNPDERYRSARELRDDLVAARTEVAPPAATKKRSSRGLAVAGAALVAIAALVLLRIPWGSPASIQSIAVLPPREPFGRSRRGVLRRWDDRRAHRPASAGGRVKGDLPDFGDAV